MNKSYIFYIYQSTYIYLLDFPAFKIKQLKSQSFQQQNKLMYNLYQYNSAVRIAERQRSEDQRYTKYILRHQDLKEKAVEKQKEKASSFIKQQITVENPFIVEDDHFTRWRPIKQYRDVQDTNKFISFKTFRHKPNYQMDKFYNERERKEILQLSKRKQFLVKSKVIPQEQRSRSLRCQGPLNPKIQFRDRKKDTEYLQPRLRYSNITDQERFNESAITFDDKFKNVYQSFEMTKSKLGKTSISPRHQRYPSKISELDDPNSEMALSKPFHFEKEVTVTKAEQNENPQRFSPTISQNFSKRSLNKTFFKLAKTMQLFSKDKALSEQIDSVLKRTQYQRRKDMTNIRYNMSNESYLKKPIL